MLRRSTHIGSPKNTRYWSSGVSTVGVRKGRLPATKFGVSGDVLGDYPHQVSNVSAAIFQLVVATEESPEAHNEPWE